MYYYNTPIGMLKIVFRNGRYDLFLNDFCGGSYYSPQAAADDVYTKTSGCSDWDLSNYEAPTDLSEWEKTSFPK